MGWHSGFVFSRKLDRQRAPTSPVRTSRLRFDQAHALRRFGFSQLRSVAMNSVRVLDSEQFVTSDLFLTGELLVDEFTRDSQSNTGLIRKSLGTSEPGIRRTNR